MRTSKRELSTASITAAAVAHSRHDATSTSRAGRRPTVTRTASRVVLSSLYSSTEIWRAEDPEEGGAAAAVACEAVMSLMLPVRGFGAATHPSGGRRCAALRIWLIWRTWRPHLQ